MPMCKRAPACQAVLTQATAIAPGRRTKSDGVCASVQHTAQNPGSDHEPHVIIAGVGYATAVDLSDDKAGGMDADAWADWLIARRDPRVKYIIRNREMASSYPARGYPGWTWRPYTGSNPHATHTHLSVNPGAVFADGPWFPADWYPQAAAPPAPPPAPSTHKELPPMYAFRDPETRNVIAASGPRDGVHVKWPELAGLIAAGAFGTAEHRQAVGWTTGPHGHMTEPPLVAGIRKAVSGS